MRPYRPLFFLVPILWIMLFAGCKEDTTPPAEQVVETPVVKKIKKVFGYPKSEYIVSRDTVRPGDSFGKILYENHVDYPTIQAITDSAKAVFDTRRIQVGKPYVLLKSKDTLEQAQVFVYVKNKEDYVVLDWQDSIQVASKKKPVTIKERELSGAIMSNPTLTMQELGVSVMVAYKMADVYAWTIDFNKLDKGDRFKVIYEEKFVDDTLYSGIGKIKACSFEHRGKTIEAYRFENDSLPGGSDFFEPNGENLRRAFLKGPLKFNRVSSHYNLKRRIRYYGYKVRPHKGTDYAGPVGTPIMATADGTVVESARRGGNGNYVKIRHNSTYSTQYLHMQKRIAKKGDFVRQGEVIGTIGMTGNTGGPHVCYRFWKNGRQVDPFKEDLPASEPLEPSLVPLFKEAMQPLKKQLDAIPYPNEDVLANQEGSLDNNQLTTASVSETASQH